MLLSPLSKTQLGPNEQHSIGPCSAELIHHGLGVTTSGLRLESFSKSIACGTIHTSQMLVVPSCPTFCPEAVAISPPKPKKLSRRYHASAEPLMLRPSSPHQQDYSKLAPPATEGRPMTASGPQNRLSLSRKSTSSIRSFFRLDNYHRPTKTSRDGTSVYREVVSQQSQESQSQSDSSSVSIPFESISQTETAGMSASSAPAQTPSPLQKAAGSLKIKFAALPRPRPSPKKIVRSPTAGCPQRRDTPDFAIPANVGLGSKSRRLSAELPEDFNVDSCELSREYCSGRRMPGRHGKEIGKGTTATVRILYKKGGSKDVRYAVKEFRKCGRNEDKREFEQKIKSEFSIANSLQHPNIVKTIRLCRNHGRWNHVMEHCDQGELYSLIQKGYLSEEDNLCFFKQLLRGVAYLHQHGIAHRDIKPENLLITAEGQLKITDFGVSEVFSGIHPGLRSAGGQCGKLMDGTRKCSPGICGSLPYIPPEVVAESGDYDPRALDVWSCAIVCITLFFHGIPWQTAKPEDSDYAKFLAGWHKFLLRNPKGKITKREFPSCGRAFAALPGNGLRRLVLKMLHPDPEMRITIEDALEDRSMRRVECCSPDVGQVTESDTALDGSGEVGTVGAWRMQKIHNHLPSEKS